MGESVATSSHSSVMKSLPIDIKQSAVDTIAKYKSDECKCVFLTLTAKKQSIEGEEQSVSSVVDIAKTLTETDPKYILFTYSKSKKENVAEEKDQLGEKKIFGYYCPEKADRKLRFTYSTCKANVIEYCSSIGLDFYSKVEVTSLNEFNTENFDYKLFPFKEIKKTFAVPKAPKNKRRKKKSRAKLDLSDL